MKFLGRIGILLILSLFTLYPVLAQESEDSSNIPDNLTPAVRAFVETFSQVDMVGKLEVVESTLDVPVEDLGFFYTEVTQYVVNNSDDVITNTNLREMAMLVFPRLIEGQISGVNDYL